jgi:hypothetical protein
VDAAVPGAGAAAPPPELLEPPEELDPPGDAAPLVEAPPDADAPPLLAAAVAALSIPPCPLQEPRPPCGEVVPSLQVTGVLVSAALTPGNASRAVHTNTPQAQET